MAENGGQAFVMEILKVFALEVEFSTESRFASAAKSSSNSLMGI